MKKIALIMFLLALAITIYGDAVARYADLVQPTRIMVDGDRMFVVQEPFINIYSLKTHKLVKKFGGEGEGPKEFLGGLNLLPYPDHIIVMSRGKITYWTKEGEFIKEIKCPRAGGVEPCEDTFVGISFVQLDDANRTGYQTIEVYDKEFKKLREVDRKLADFQNNRGFTYFNQPYYFYIMENSKIIITGHDGYLLNVYDKNGKKLFEYKRDIKPRRVTEKDRIAAKDFFENHPNAQIRAMYRGNRHLLLFAETIQPIQGFQAFGDKLFVWTNFIKGDTTQFDVFDNKGNFITSMDLPLRYVNRDQIYPFTIANNNFYHLVENEDDEVWELFVTPLKVKINGTDHKPSTKLASK